MTVSVRRACYDKAKYVLKSDPFIYRIAVQNCFFLIVFLLTTPSLFRPSLRTGNLFSKSKLPASLTFSCFSVSISVVLLAVSLAHAELYHLVLAA